MLVAGSSASAQLVPNDRWADLLYWESREAAEVSTFDFKVEKSEPAPIKMTPLDKKFLRSLKITVEEEEG